MVFYDAFVLRQDHYRQGHYEIKVIMKLKLSTQCSSKVALLGVLMFGGLFSGNAFAQSANSKNLSKLVTNQSLVEPLDLCEGLPTDNEPRKVRQVARPPYGQRYRDPAFGSTVVRITNSSADEVYKPAYSTMQAWNADESLMMLYKISDGEGQHILLDGFTYKPIKALDFWPSDVEEVFWSHNDPDTMFYVSKAYPDYGSFIKLNVRTDEKTVLRNFEGMCGKNIAPTSGGDVLMQSLDDNTFGFRCDTGDNWTMFSYDVKEDKVTTALLGDDKQFDNWTAPLPLSNGDGFWMQGKIIGPDLTTVRATFDMYKHHEHADKGISSDGRDVYYATAFNISKGRCNNDVYGGVGHLIEHDAKTGECRPVITEKDGWPYTTRGTHISGRAVRKPGWVAMSSIGYDKFDLFKKNKKASPLFSEIYLVDTNPDSERVCRVAQHRSYGKSSQNGEYNSYFAEPHATISPSGTRILFGSNWYDSGSVDAYVVELPAYSRLINSQ